MINTPQRPKAEADDDQILVVDRLISVEGERDLVPSQLDIILGPNFLITFRDQHSK